MKITAIVCSGIAIVWVLLTIVQLWAEPFSYAVFFKISVSAGLLFALVLGIGLVVREYLSEKSMKENNYIDD